MKSKKLSVHTRKLKVIISIVSVCILATLFFTYFKQPEKFIEKDVIGNSETAYQDLIVNLTSGCSNKIAEKSVEILKFVHDNLEITKEGVSKNDVEKLFCVDCLKHIGSPQINTKTGNFEVFYSYHNRYYSDKSFDEFVTCIVNPNYEVIKLYVKAGVSHAS